MTEETTELPAPENVTEAIARIMGELPAIGKTRDPNGGVKYAFRGIEAITAELQELCAKYSVVFLPSVRKMKTVDIVVNGNPWTDTFLIVDYLISHGPSDTNVNVSTRGIGRDNSDKGANKAMTQAFKYALLQVFMIADPKDDGDSASHQADAGSATGRRGRGRGATESATVPASTEPPQETQPATGRRRRASTPAANVPSETGEPGEVTDDAVRAAWVAEHGEDPLQWPFEGLPPSLQAEADEATSANKIKDAIPGTTEAEPESTAPAPESPRIGQRKANGLTRRLIEHPDPVFQKPEEEHADWASTFFGRPIKKLNELTESEYAQAIAAIDQEG